MDKKINLDAFYQNKRNYYIIKGITSLIFLAFTVRFAYTMYENHQEGKQLNFVNILLFLQELVTFLIITFSRMPKDTNITIKSTILTTIATYYFLVISFSDTEATRALMPLNFCVIIMLLGLIWQIISKMCLGRSFGILPANRGIVDYGPYRFMRHPIYFGYLCTHMGFLLGSFSLWNFSVYAIVWTSQCFRILEEEKVLSRDPAYQEFKKKVRFRLIPFIF